MHSTRNDPPISRSFPNAPKKLALASKHWFLAARPKTWIASLSPVCIGTFMVDREHLSYGIFLLTALFSLSIQIGTNFANDYFDFMKGADTEERQGPKRAVQSGWISPSNMRHATIYVFIASFLLAIPLMILAGAWSLPMTAIAIALGLLYTGGPKPLGYLGLGEVLVLIFFGPVATCGSYFLQTHTLSDAVLIASLSPGLLSCSLLIANNLRDEQTDKIANKKTLVVRWGRLFGSLEYLFSLASALLVPMILILFYRAPLNLLSAFFLFPIAVSLIKKAFAFNHPKELLPLLQGTSLLLFFYTVLFSLAYLYGSPRW